MFIATSNTKQDEDSKSWVRKANIPEGIK